MSALDARTRAGFAAAFGRAPDGVVFVPGRVNLIGEHVDYNDGLVLPMPISTGTAIAWARGSGEDVTAIALDLGAAPDQFDPADVAPLRDVDWRAYVRGMASSDVWGGARRGGVQMAIAGSIPRGSGLSSSASLCVAVGRALAAAWDIAIGDTVLALAAQTVEHRWAGVYCGVMDQMAVAAGQPGAALLLDCASFDHSTVALPADWAVMIVQSGVRRELASGAYNARRVACEAAAAALGVASLRQADAAMVERADLPLTVARRARHVVQEIARVGEAAEAIAAGDIARMGALMRASHASLRDLFEVSHPDVDRLAEVLDEAIGSEGGARMTGGGFGGAVVAILAADRADEAAAHVARNYRPPVGGLAEPIIEALGRAAAEENP